jgi:hypothetical protein
MLDDEINKRINEAANHYHPAYDDEAWQRMEQMLDEHLPQKKDRRRIFFLLFFAVIICTGLFFVFYPHQKNEPSPHISNANSKNYLKPDNKKAELSINNPLKKIENNNNHGVVLPVNKNVITQQKPITHGVTSISTNKKSFPENTSGSMTIRINKNETSEANNESATAEVIPLNNVDKSIDTSKNSNENVLQELGTNEVANKISATNDQDSTKNKQTAKVENSKQSKSNNGVTKIDKSFKKNFGITISTGAEASGLTVSKAGKLSVSYGAGLSYDLSRRFTLRAGFYVDKKIYSVGKNDYYSQPGNVVNYNYLQSIDGDCKVYEIPLVVNFNFGNTKKHSWFAAVGLSSYLMKKESYVYYYKYPSGNTYEKSWSISNKNKYYFSVLNLSAGYEYTINKRISLMAEPYVKLPFSGVGAGKIKLNSAGILFTATIKPFKK